MCIILSHSHSYFHVKITTKFRDRKGTEQFHRKSANNDNIRGFPISIELFVFAIDYRGYVTFPQVIGLF